MTRRTIERDPDVETARRKVERVATAVEDGTASDAALAAAEMDLSRALVAAERRAERADAVARERQRQADADAARAARWRAVAPQIRDVIDERRRIGAKIGEALTAAVQAVAEWEELPRLEPMLVDAPTAMLRDRHVDKDWLREFFTGLLRPVARSLGLPPRPLPAPALRRPFADILDELYAPIVAALDTKEA